MKKQILCLLMAASLSVTAKNNFSLISKVAFKQASRNGPYDVVIVPGVPYLDSAMSRVMESRIKWACHLYQIGYTRNIIFSGAAVYTPYIEGKIFALYAEKYGVPKEHIFSEIRAEHSTENLYYSYKMAKKLGFEKIALATDPFQSITLKRYANDRFLDVSSIPIVFKILSTLTFPEVTIDPSSAKADANFVPLPDRETFLQRFMGTLGTKINEDIDD